ncbi:uncharacterized protein [Euwallacea fornicatus]|uniref:uncharacterized protein n=1 Tax=Euwallacea fornicatus TaxID=995702 RepID=UPI00338ED708
MQTPPISVMGPGDADQCSSSKRRRAPNYTDKEVRILMKLIFEHIEVIENKKTDSETWRVKDLIWNSIAESFNNCVGVSKRTVEMIRQKYDSMKKIARKKEAKNREELGKEEPNFVELEEYEKDLIQMLEAHGGNAFEPTTVLLPETKFPGTNIKTEHVSIPPSDSIPEGENDRFIVTDEDMLWDLPSDLVNRPRLHLVKRQLEHLEREEQRQITEHEHRMRTQEVKRKVLLSTERRARIEHRKRMELLELDIELKKRALALEDGQN